MNIFVTYTSRKTYRDLHGRGLFGKVSLMVQLDEPMVVTARRLSCHRLMLAWIDGELTVRPITADFLHRLQALPL